jgi:hypothetical protein
LSIKKKDKQQPPTEEEFIRFKPQRGPYTWEITKEGTIEIKVPKFTSSVGISFCKLLRKDNTFTANLDPLGSFIWKQCTGTKTVKSILVAVKKEYPDEKNIDQRLYVFLQQLHALGYLTLT